jgi:tRNA G10  N-methylase Trm11
VSVLAATAWPTNADLIADCARLGYLRDEWHTLDPTYGRGTWWRKFQPAHLTTHDLKIDGIDFRALPEPDDHFDAVAFDPPYVSMGGRATTTLGDYQERYGADTAPLSPAGVQTLINEGLCELQRVVRPRGIVLVKCQDYVSSGKLWAGTHKTLAFALELGFEYVDRLEHIAPAPRPQPPGRLQVHARRNLSTLLVLRRPR